MPQALLVSHGFPSEPDPQEARMAELARDVAKLLPGWQVAGATLAKEGALEGALSKLDRPLIYPFFMAEGYFTTRALPRRLKAAGQDGLHQCRPFGADPALIAVVAEAAKRAGAGPDVPLMLAAHGSQVSKTSKDTTHAMAEALRGHGLPDIRCAFVEEPPYLEQVARQIACAGEGGASGVCLPFFALRAGHVVGDIPEALEAAGFTGPALPPIGEDRAVPALIAHALQAELAAAAAN